MLSFLKESQISLSEPHKEKSSFASVSSSLGSTSTSGWFQTPTFMIIGVQKAGTTSLARYIQSHPFATRNSYNASTNTTTSIQQRGKEYHFFDRGNCRGFTDQTVMEKYITERNFPDAPQHFMAEQIHQRQRSYLTFDATPSYLFESSTVPSCIRRFLPHVRHFVISLRRPIDRAYSHYCMMQSRNSRIQDNNITFEDVMEEELRSMREAGLWVPTKSFYNSTTNTHAKPNFDRNEFDLDKLDKAWTRYLQNPLHLNQTYGMIARGLYALQLHQWLQHYPLSCFVFLNFHEMAMPSATNSRSAEMDFGGGNSQQTPKDQSKPLPAKRRLNGAQRTYNQMLQFLNLPPADLPIDMSEQAFFVTPGKDRVPPMKEETRVFLQELYRPYDEYLVEILGYDPYLEIA